ncbi:Tetratricopeptide repeat protein 21B [Phytophthora nicotianae]|nr:Tetratricopeptide repeat protein 21B [Phytophthora nicotianae]KUF85059.1 Tetratricopeptide repeat protein 21B [Phytophthora nicotianae]KUF85152.1 Tetratricopeptide repeat protein 21B [Phytophthora nicotianae]KUF87822.1 Tetratricopeptide repeat protein 21B [Phytophthora nicotianae]KUF90488.1 Tetratricopeptide repeat protein 21B [Phytophthora nicotianae]
MGNWDQCTDSVERAFSENSRDIEALRIMILLLLSRDGRAQHAIQLNPESGVFRAERGYQRALLGDFAEAMESYKEALKFPSSPVRARTDQALSYDFSVRQSISYYIIKARIFENSGDVREALQTLQTAMKMTQSTGISGIRRQKPSENDNVSLFGKASVYIHMAQVLSQLNDISEATKTVREALDVFRGTSQEVRVLVANSELAIKRGDYDAAIAMLSSVPVASPAFTKAQMVKADIYLQYRKDKHLYARCYQELVAINPCHATHVSLAEAYLRIQMLDEAVQSFERAKALSPGDPTTIRFRTQ